MQAETERLGKIVAGQLKADETTLVEIAATLIGVEDQLDDQLVGLILPKDAGELAQVGEDNEFQQVQSAVLRECIVNLARIKEAITQNGRRHARCGRPRQLAGPDARHQGRPAACSARRARSRSSRPSRGS